VVELLRGGAPAVGAADAGERRVRGGEAPDPDDAAADKVVVPFGIREIRFDPTRGFLLNVQPMRLRGVAMHQDQLGKGWATTTADQEESLRLIQEVGANAVRLGHYPFDQYVARRASELGLALWVEKASGLRTTVGKCTTVPPSDAYLANARQQLQETIRQFYNHAAVVTWSVGNETAAGQSGCDPSYDNVTPYLRALHQLAKEEDPSRPTTLAEFTEGIESGSSIFGKISFASTGITDIIATNRYYPWYNLDFEEFGALLDSIRARHPEQPLGVSEYGAGAAMSHHTDNWLAGPPEVRSPPAGTPPDQVTYQPEEYGAYFHELNWGLFVNKPYLWGTFVWNMFDFGSDHRREGDVIGVNTKGLVTFDRKTRKDAFFFYKANWSTEPVTYITSRRYTDRAYAVNPVKVYSNADSIQLAVNGQQVGALRARDCTVKVCVFEDVKLRQGVNALVATGFHGGRPDRDSVQWSLNTEDVNIAAGRLATGFRAADGSRFGSDHYFTGGQGAYIELGQDATGAIPPVDGTDDDGLFKYFRHGSFGYEIPLDDGQYEVTLGFLEPDRNVAVGGRVFSVTANGRPVVENFDVLREARTHRTAVRRTFAVTVTGGNLALAFRPVRGEAIVSNIVIRKSQ
jgi:beta-galactosidase